MSGNLAAGQSALYLLQIRWGARYGRLRHESHRWFTSVLIHASTLHVASNTFMFIALATYIEAKLGTWRSAGDKCCCARCFFLWQGHVISFSFC